MTHQESTRIAQITSLRDRSANVNIRVYYGPDQDWHCAELSNSHSCVEDSDRRDTKDSRHELRNVAEDVGRDGSDSDVPGKD